MIASSAWIPQSGIPEFGIALLEALRFSEPRQELLNSLSESNWGKLLGFCDAAQLTLTLGHFCKSSMPSWVRSRIDQNYRDNGVRSTLLQSATAEVIDHFARRDVRCVLLKGAAHAPHFTPDPSIRSTGDIDLWCLPEQMAKARDELFFLGYRAIATSKQRHLPPMARQTQWQWRGDYFAADLPIPIELHYRLWDEALEHIRAPGECEFWNRRSCAPVAGKLLPVLALQDAIAFAALHLLMHILHGDLRLQRACEIGYFLNTRAADEAFWLEWKQLHAPELRTLEALVFVLVERWFGCKLPRQVQHEAEALSPDVKLWINRYAWSPVQALFAPNKNELWLNLCLIESLRARVSVFLRRMVPFHLSSAVDRRSFTMSFYRLKHFTSRAIYHSRTAAPTLLEGVKWWYARQRLGQRQRCVA